jgi:hypothetical protein
MHEIHYLSLGINLVNLIIIALLLFIYVRNYRHIKSKFNTGLIVFSLLFFAENISSIISEFLSWNSEIFDAIVANFVVINFIELLGLLTLLYITRE